MKQYSDCVHKARPPNTGAPQRKKYVLRKVITILLYNMYTNKPQYVVVFCRVDNTLKKILKIFKFFLKFA